MNKIILILIGTTFFTGIIFGHNANSSLSVVNVEEEQEVSTYELLAQGGRKTSVAEKNYLYRNSPSNKNGSYFTISITRENYHFSADKFYFVITAGYDFAYQTTGEVFSINSDMIVTVNAHFNFYNGGVGKGIYSGSDSLQCNGDYYHTKVYSYGELIDGYLTTDNYAYPGNGHQFKEFPDESGSYDGAYVYSASVTVTATYVYQGYTYQGSDTFVLGFSNN